MHERFFSHGGSALSSILRNTVNRMGNSYVVQGGRSDSWRHAFGGRGGAGGPSSATSALLASANSLKFKGRQLLDQEGMLFSEIPGSEMSCEFRFSWYSMTS